MGEVSLSAKSKFPLGDEAPLNAKLLVAFSPVFMLVVVIAVRGGVNNILGVLVNELNAMAYYSIALLILNIASAIASPLAGSLGDIFGRKRVAIWSLIPFTLSLVLCGVAHNTAVLLVAFFLLGFTYALCQSIVATMIADVVSGKARAQLLGWRHSAGQAAIMLGPVLLGLLSDHLNARTTFLVIAPIGLVSLLLIIFLFPDIRYHSGNTKIDWAGTIFLTLAMGPITFLLSMGGEQIPWMSAQSFVMAAVSVASIFLFVRAERRASNPIISPELFQYRGFAPVLIYKGLMNTSGSLTTSYLVLFAQTIIGFSATQTGAFSMARIASIVCSIFVGQWIGQKKMYRGSFLISSLLTIVAIAILITINQNSTFVIIFAALILTYAGISFGTVPCSLLPAIILPAEQRGVGLGAVWFAENVATTVSTAVYALVINLCGGDIVNSYKYLVLTFLGFTAIRLIMQFTSFGELKKIEKNLESA